MAILLFCQYCTAEHTISGLGKHQHLAEIVDRLGWELTRVGWLCPLHRGEYLIPLLCEKAREARDRWFDAINEFDRAIFEVSSGLLHPDGSLLIEHAGRKRAAAFAKYQDAFAKYKDALNRSHIPYNNPGH